jgi:hypothetical protein
MEHFSLILRNEHRWDIATDVREKMRRKYLTACANGLQGTSTFWEETAGLSVGIVPSVKLQTQPHEAKRPRRRIYPTVVKDIIKPDGADQWVARFTSILENAMDQDAASRESAEYVNQLIQSDRVPATQLWWEYQGHHELGLVRGDNSSVISIQTAIFHQESRDAKLWRYGVVQTAPFEHEVAEHPSTNEWIVNEFNEWVLRRPHVTTVCDLQATDRTYFASVVATPVRVVRTTQLQGPPPNYLTHLPPSPTMQRKQTWASHFFDCLSDWMRNGDCTFFVANLPKNPEWCVSRDSDSDVHDHYKVLRIKGRLGYLSTREIGGVLDAKSNPMELKKIHKSMRFAACIPPMTTHAGVVHSRCSDTALATINYYDVRFDKMNDNTLQCFQARFGIENVGLYTNNAAYI